MLILILNEQPTLQQQMYFDGAKRPILFIKAESEDEVKEVVNKFLNPDKDEKGKDIIDMRILKIFLNKDNLENFNFWCRIIEKGRIQREFRL